MNLINNQPDIDKIYLYAKDPYEAKYQYLINKRESTGLKHFNNPKGFIEYSNEIQDVYKNTEESIKSYFKVPKEVRLNTTHSYLMKIPNKRELQQISLNHSSDIDFKDFMKIYKNILQNHSFLVNDTNLPSDNR